MATPRVFIRRLFVVQLVTMTLILTSNASLTSTLARSPWLGAWTAAQQGKLNVVPGTLRFGKVSIGQTKSLSATLTNTQTKSVIISNLTESGAGFSATGFSLPFTLAAGQSTQLSVSFSPQASGQAMGNIVLTSNASNKTLTLYLQGGGTTGGTLVANPSSINFGNVGVGDSQTLSEAITNSGGASITVTQAATASANFSLNGLTLPFTLLPGQSFTFGVVFSPQAGGVSTDNISITSNASNPTLNVGLAGTGVAAGQLAVSPAGLVFGDVTTGTSKSLSATLNASVSSVTVTSHTASNPAFTLSGMSFPATIAAGQSLPVTVTFTPLSNGLASGSESFASNAGNSPTDETMTGNGTGPVSHSVALSWNSDGSGIVGFYVYRGSRLGGPYTKINTESDPNPSYLDAAVVSGQTYYYVATAVNTDGVESSYSNEIQAVIPRP